MNRLGIKYAWDTRCAPGYYIYDGKCDGTYNHTRDGARVPTGDVTIERGRTLKVLLRRKDKLLLKGGDFILGLDMAMSGHLVLSLSKPL